MHHTGKAPPDSLKRSFVTFDQGGQTRPPRSNDFFFGAADDMRAADDRPAGRLAGRPTERLAEHPTQKSLQAALIKPETKYKRSYAFFFCFALRLRTFVQKLLTGGHNLQPQPQTRPSDHESWICIF